MAKLGTLLDQLLRADLAVKEQEAKVKKLKDAYTRIEEEVFNEFGKEEIDGASGRVAIAALSRPVYPTLDSYEALERFVYRNKALDLFTRRLHKTNWLDRLEVRKGRPIPGIKTFEKVTLSVKPRKKRR